MTPAEFKDIRKEIGLTQTELGNKIGRSLRMIQAYELGEKEIPLIVANAMRVIAS